MTYRCVGTSRPHSMPAGISNKATTGHGNAAPIEWMPHSGGPRLALQNTSFNRSVCSYSRKQSHSSTSLGPPCVFGLHLYLEFLTRGVSRFKSIDILSLRRRVGRTWLFGTHASNRPHACPAENAATHQTAWPRYEFDFHAPFEFRCRCGGLLG
jgi:hypothetical protein